jgi:hypothetical protein
MRSVKAGFGHLCQGVVVFLCNAPCLPRTSTISWGNRDSQGALRLLMLHGVENCVSSVVVVVLQATMPSPWQPWAYLKQGKNSIFILRIRVSGQRIEGEPQLGIDSHGRLRSRSVKRLCAKNETRLGKHDRLVRNKVAEGFFFPHF